MIQRRPWPDLGCWLEKGPGVLCLLPQLLSPLAAIPGRIGASCTHSQMQRTPTHTHTHTHTHMRQEAALFEESEQGLNIPLAFAV